MRKLFSMAVFCSMIFLTTSCSKRYHPSSSTATVAPAKGAYITPISGVSLRAEKPNVVTDVVKPEAEATKKTAEVKPKPKEETDIPKVITVNDAAAHRSVDGRYYYDVLGHRYWRNNKDGKYYLFDKSMYQNDAFKKQN